MKEQAEKAKNKLLQDLNMMNVGGDSPGQDEVVTEEQAEISAK